MIRLTDKRLEWLRLLQWKEPLGRNRTNVGFYCMQAGWTEWNYRNDAGEDMTAAEAKERYGEKYWEIVSGVGERLTELGRAVLEGPRQ